MAAFPFSSKCKYYAKNFMQKGIGSIPYMVELQEWTKKVSGYYKKRTNPSDHGPRIKAKVEVFNNNEIKPPKVVVEQGTGWIGADPILFFLGGATETYTYDTMPWLREEMFRDAVQQMLKHLDIVECWNGVESELLRERASQLETWVSLPFTELLDAMGIRYSVATTFEYPEVTNGSVDLFYSSSVFQRASVSDLKRAATRSYELLRDGGMGYHRVHPRDHNFITDRSIPPFYYLGIPEWQWNLMTSKFINYQNRLRGVEFVEIFKDAGFDVQTDNIVNRPEDIEYVKLHLTSQYPDYSLEDIANFQTDLILRKRGDTHSA